MRPTYGYDMTGRDGGYRSHGPTRHRSAMVLVIFPSLLNTFSPSKCSGPGERLDRETSGLPHSPAYIQGGCVLVIFPFEIDFYLWEVTLWVWAQTYMPMCMSVLFNRISGLYSGSKGFLWTKISFPRVLHGSRFSPESDTRVCMASHQGIEATSNTSTGLAIQLSDGNHPGRPYPRISKTVRSLQRQPKHRQQAIVSDWLSSTTVCLAHAEGTPALWRRIRRYRKVQEICPRICPRNKYPQSSTGSSIFPIIELATASTYF